MPVSPAAAGVETTRLRPQLMGAAVAKPNIVYLPGLLGSILGYRVPLLGVDRVVWLDPTILSTGELVTLQLAADGISPGPQSGGWMIRALGQWVWSYEPLAAWLSAQGWPILRVAYDWRKSVVSTAGAVLRLIDAAYPGQPFVALAHSMGGLLGRAVYSLMVARGDAARMARLVCMGTPHWGSWEAMRTFWRLGAYYHGMQAADYVRTLVTYGVPTSALDVIVASWPGVYGLLPWRDSGPLQSTNPALAQALYNRPWWAGANPFMTQLRLDAAAGDQAVLAGRWPVGRTPAILGVGQSTAYELVPAAPLGMESAYRYSTDGDGAVPRVYGVLPGEALYTVQSSHYFLPLSPDVWRLLPALLS